MDLPEEMWLEIFKYLDTSDLRCSVSRVCFKWHRVVQDSSLYSHVILDYKLKNESISLVKQYRPFIMYIEVRHEANLDLLLDNIMMCGNLQLLRLDYCRQCIGNIPPTPLLFQFIINLSITDFKMSIIKAIFKSCKYLTRFEILYELSPIGKSSLRKISIIRVTFFRTPPFNKFIMTIYTKKGWTKNRTSMSAIIHFEKHKCHESLYKMNIKEFICRIAQQTFGLFET